MRYVLLLLGVALATPALAQATHFITVMNFQFTPPTLEIVAGDSVVWDNTDGFHSVNETTLSSPAGFGNAIANAPWTYGFLFTVAGEYTYECGFHGASMSGSITVMPGTATEEGPASAYDLDVAPNPFARAATLRINVARTQHVRAAVVDLAGREVTVLHDAEVSAGEDLEVTWAPGRDVASGIYVVRIDAESFATTRRLVFSR